MASHRQKMTKDGKPYYEIRVSRGRGQSYLSTRWYIPDGWSARAIQRELLKQEAEFERRCKRGEVLSSAERKEKAQREAQKAAAIQTLRQYGEGVYMPKKAITTKESTRAFYQALLEKHIYPALGDRLLPEITTADLNALLLKMQKANYSHSTCGAVYTTLEQIFTSAYNTDLIDRNPMHKADKPAASKSVLRDEKVKAYTIEEVHAILDGLETEPLKWRAFVRLLIDTGMRRGEACALKWRYIDAKNCKITIAGNLEYSSDYGGSEESAVYYTGTRKTKSGKETRGAVYYTTPKSGKSRTIEVDQSIIKLLQALRLEQGKNGIISEYVFTQDDSPLPMQPQSPTKYMARFAERFGVEDLHPHKLRHTFASIAIANGADIAAISRKLGHANVAITLRIYTHANEESEKRANQRFREAIARKQA
ncbi:MAG: site-specific integrase [Oscillospiraceae bacterium]|nr:site-specific integrase [Oscillospiraceae bacterium]